MDGKEKQVREHRYNFGRFFKEHDKKENKISAKHLSWVEFYRNVWRLNYDYIRWNTWLGY